MKIDIAKAELQTIRDVIDDCIWRREHCTNPAAWGSTPSVLRKFNRKLNRALKQAYGHDCNGSHYYT